MTSSVLRSSVSSSTKLRSAAASFPRAQPCRLALPSVGAPVTWTSPRSSNRKLRHPQRQGTPFARALGAVRLFSASAASEKLFKLADIGEGITECEIVKWCVSHRATAISQRRRSRTPISGPQARRGRRAGRAVRPVGRGHVGQGDGRDHGASRGQGQWLDRQRRRDSQGRQASLRYT